jgi:glyoxylase-like metal-dependent hydrolase (beta-lactamase superfamily II)/ferredoxin
MADIKKRLPGNAPGEFFVDRTCENCDVCRQIAPETFGTASRGRPVVISQPQTAQSKRRAMWSILSCPNGSIGMEARGGLAEVMADFPLPIEDDVYYCGLNTLKSAGGNAYFIQHPDGNWMCNTPKFQAQLVKRIRELGGLKYIFISHRDDVGENDKYAEEFGAKRIIHKADLEAQPNAEKVIDGFDPLEISPGFTIIPTPGHTEGHCMLLFRSKFLLSGDSLYFDRKSQRIDAWGPYWTWYSFQRQSESVARLAEYSFEWILPTHGQRVKLPPAEMRLQILGAAERAMQVSNKTPHDLKRAKILKYYAGELTKLNQADYARLMQERADAMRNSVAMAQVGA